MRRRGRRFLRRLGPSWEYAPVRRLVQVLSLLLFLGLLFYVSWPYGFSGPLRIRETSWRLEAGTFVALDPLVSVSAAVGARAWVRSLAWAGGILLACLVFPRGFCGYVCPLGTLIDAFDRLRLPVVIRRLRLPAVIRRMARRPARRGAGDEQARRGWWVHLRYYVLAGVFVAALFGVVLSGFVAALPVVTRGLVAGLGPLQTGVLVGWSAVPPMKTVQVVSVVLLVLVLGLGLLGPRFWCRCLCPTGAVFSVWARLRLTGRHVAPTCVRCSRCVRACSFDAVKADFTTRGADCTFCQVCGGACPVGAIRFGSRWDAEPLPQIQGSGSEDADSRAVAPAPAERPVSRRGFLAGTAAGLGTVLGARAIGTAGRGPSSALVPVRPPGSVPEAQFVAMCVRCGHCIQACPTKVLQPMGIEGGLQTLWTPRLAADWAACDPSCRNCGLVCPTGAIRALPLEEKRAARMGRASVNVRTCLPHAGRQACQLCVDACALAGRQAIEFRRVGVEFDEEGVPLEESGFLAPEVIEERCVGCGLCQARCWAVNVAERRLLAAAAIRVEAGRGKEDRLRRGSYRALRDAERRKREADEEAQTVDDVPYSFEVPK